jgi:hypothetical protein
MIVALDLPMIAFGLMQNSTAMMLRMNQVKEKKS